MPGRAAHKKKSFHADRFKDIQLSLFEFLKLNPLAKFKGKDLKGPLKFLEPQHSSSNDSVLAKPTSAEAPEQSLTLTENHSLYILGYPTSIERKAYLRYLRFHLKPNGVLHIVAPKNRSLDLIQKEVSEYKDWLDKKNYEFEKVRATSPQKFWKNGEAFPFIGKNFWLKLEPFTGARALLQLDLDQLHFFYPQAWDDLPTAQRSVLFRKELLKFYKSKAIIDLSARVRNWSTQMQLYPRQLSFRNQKTRWGSCSSQGKISLNWRLVAYAPELIDYIVIHELAHLKHQNHSHSFWNLVKDFCPNYKALRQQLNQQQYKADFLAPVPELYIENPIFSPLKTQNEPQETAKEQEL